MASARRRAEGGFTLLEVLVALVVLGFLVVGLTQGVRSGLALRQAQIHRLGDTAELDATMRLLRRLLTRLPVIPAGNRLITTATGAGFRGEPDRVSFVGDLPSGLGTTRRADLSLYVADGSLVLSWVPHRHERSLVAVSAPTRTVLLEGIQRLQLAYWGAPANGERPGWQARWESQEAPQLIRVRLIFARGDRRQWPDLIAASRL
ncbi:MAG TPA: prepilin-type N-terminal cleavage/methylation domain-containing protein [Stellaceae bacterium]|nr:prepilin-type N-terminal cleavage/methylation domain-containing protein [Stellaceae bacterium]